MATSQRDGYTAGLARSLMKGVERWQFIVDECPTALLRIFVSSFFVHKYDPLPPAPHGAMPLSSHFRTPRAMTACRSLGCY